MNIAVFGGSFNPPHLGHFHLAKSVCESLKIDTMLIMPVKTPPHKSSKEMESEDDRLNMCRLAFSGLDGCVVSHLEMKMEGKSYTVLTMRKLREYYPDAKIYFVMGSDMLTSFTKWYEWQEILTHCSLICVSRYGDDLESLNNCAEEINQYGECIVLNIEAFEASSTQIRDMIENGEDTSSLLDKKVISYINEKSLYR